MVSDLTLAQPKTKLLSQALAQLGLAGSVLLVVGEGRMDVVQAGKNLSKVTLVRPEELNVYDVLRCDSLVIPQREMDRVREVWS